ncbi:hypothetical protein DV738_g1310, partial [Chaetothyriales sp. CBS 135597]
MDYGSVLAKHAGQVNAQHVIQGSDIGIRHIVDVSPDVLRQLRTAHLEDIGEAPWVKKSIGKEHRFHLSHLSHLSDRSRRPHPARRLPISPIHTIAPSARTRAPAMLGPIHAGLVLALGLGVTAQSYIDRLSFGHQTGVSPSSFAIPGWSMLGQDYVPQLLSDKVILTPPYGANKKGSMWADGKNWLPSWQADLEFRVGATERGVGNLQLWYVGDSQTQGSTHTLYTVHQFDGLVLVIDTIGGVQKIRGFLNDGTIDYASHANVDGLAFGHCDYVYRNRPTSRLSVKSTPAGLSVTIDDQLCFSSDKIALPVGDHFGLTASSGDPPDSFEVFKFGAQVIASLENRLATVESLLREILRTQAAASAAAAAAPKADYSQHFAQLSEQLQKTHEGVTEHIPLRMREYVQAHTPRIGFILYSFMAFQTCCIGAWGWYKWRKSTMPKKYL